MGLEHASILVQLVTGVISGLVTGIACFLALRTELRYMRRDLDHAWQRIDNHASLITALQLGQAVAPPVNQPSKEPR